MKRSLRLPFTLLILLALCSTLTLRFAVRRRRPPPLPLINTTLLQLASTDPAEPDLRKDVDDLLDGNLPSSSSSRHRSVSLYRRQNHLPHPNNAARFAVRHPIRLRAPKDYQIFPEFRRSLRDWFLLRRRLPAPVFPDLSPLPRRYPSCAVVGNSGILLQRDHGPLIDAHDLVVRLNNARISGYARSVGAKTGLSFVNSNILHLCARREGCFCHPYGDSVPIVMYICQAVHFLDYTVCNTSHKAPLLITDPRFDLLCARIVKYYSLQRFVASTGKLPEEWGKVHDERAFHYSSGMQAIVLALGICDEVGIFGFGKSDGAKHHYHTNQKTELDLHDYEAEYDFYRDLVERPQCKRRWMTMRDKGWGKVAMVARTTGAVVGVGSCFVLSGREEGKREKVRQGMVVMVGLVGTETYNRKEGKREWGGGLKIMALGIYDEVGIFGFGKLDGAKHHYHTNQKTELDLRGYEAEFAFYRIW